MGRPIELEGPLGDLAERVGGVKLLAEQVGVTARSIQRYASGEIFPPAPMRKVLAVLASVYGLPPPYPEPKAARRA
jgi:hypothetical protein